MATASCDPELPPPPPLYVYLSWLSLRKEKAARYRGILECVLSQRLVCSSGSELRLQLLVLHHHHVDPLFHPLQLVLPSKQTEREKEM